MNFGFIIYIIGWLLNVQGGFLLVPCIVAMIYGEKSGFAFFVSAIISFILGIICTRKKPQNRSFYAKEGFITVALGWIVFSISGALMFLMLYLKQYQDILLLVLLFFLMWKVCQNLYYSGVALLTG